MMQKKPEVDFKRKEMENVREYEIKKMRGKSKAIKLRRENE